MAVQNSLSENQNPPNYYCCVGIIGLIISIVLLFIQANKISQITEDWNRISQIYLLMGEKDSYYQILEESYHTQIAYYQNLEGIFGLLTFVFLLVGLLTNRISDQQAEIIRLQRNLIDFNSSITPVSPSTANNHSYSFRTLDSFLKSPSEESNQAPVVQSTLSFENKDSTKTHTYIPKIETEFFEIFFQLDQAIEKKDLNAVFLYFGQITEPKSIPYSLRIKLANFLIKRNKLILAEQVFQTWPDTEKENDIYWAGLGLLYHRLDRFKEARDCYLRAIQLNPQNIIYPKIIEELNSHVM